MDETVPDSTVVAPQCSGNCTTGYSWSACGCAHSLQSSTTRRKTTTDIGQTERGNAAKTSPGPSASLLSDVAIRKQGAVIELSNPRRLLPCRHPLPLGIRVVGCEHCELSGRGAALLGQNRQCRARGDQMTPTSQRDRKEEAKLTQGGN